MYKLAVIADSDSILAFQAVGFDAFRVSLDEAEDELRRKYKSGKYAVIFVSEDIAEAMPEVMDEFEKKPFPAISVLPVGRDVKNIGLSRMRKTCINATGTDIISKIS